MVCKGRRRNGALVHGGQDLGQKDSYPQQVERFVLRAERRRDLAALRDLQNASEEIGCLHCSGAFEIGRATVVEVEFRSDVARAQCWKVQAYYFAGEERCLMQRMDNAEFENLPYSKKVGRSVSLVTNAVKTI